MISYTSRTVVRALVSHVLLLTGLACYAQEAKSIVAVASPAASAKRAAAFAKLPLSFEPNRGQTDAGVQFLARTPEASVFLTGPDAVIKTSRFIKGKNGVERIDGSSSVRMHLAGTLGSTVVAAAEQPLSGTANYMHGNDSARWQTNVPTYGGVRFASIYPGVDLRYHGHAGQLEYDFIIAPNANPSAVKLQFQGSQARLEANGDLVLPVVHGEDLRFDRPVAYQMVDGKRMSVDASYEVAFNQDVTFRLGSYDHSRELVIDPTLAYLGTLGAGAFPGAENVSQIVVDSAGSLYFIGTTNDPAYPVTTGAYQPVCGPANTTAASSGYVYCSGNNTSAFVTKLSADGTKLVYSTYLSGHGGGEAGNNIAVDSAGVAYLFGTTGSDDFPVTSDAWQKRCYAFYGAFNAPNPVPCDGFYNGGGTQYTVQNQEGFFAKLNATGSALLYSSFLGGAQAIYPAALGLDSGGNIYLYGQTVDLGAQNQSYGHLQYTGLTSTGFQTISTFGPSKNSDIQNAAFLSKFSNDGHTLLYGTFFDDNAGGVPVLPTAMAVGSNGIAYIGGYSIAANQNDTAGTLKTACTVADSNNPGNCTTVDGFVAAIDTTKSGAASLAWATRLGGTAPSQGSNTPEQVVYGLTVDSSGNIYATGYTGDHTFPVGTGGYQATCPNYDPSNSTDFCNSAYVVKINSSGTKVLAGSFLGGPDIRSSGSVGTTVRVDSRGMVYLYGISYDGGGDFPQVNALQSYKAGNQLFISTFSADLSKLIFSTRFGNPSPSGHAVSGVVSGAGLTLDPSDNVYFAGTTTDGTFGVTTGTYSTSQAGGGSNHGFFAKLSKVLQPDTTTLTVTPTTVGQGNSIIYKAVVAGTLQNTPVPTGTVTFSATSGSTTTTLGTGTLDTTGTAILMAAAPAAGTYTIVATYSADSVYDVSTSTSTTLTVTSTASSTTTLTASPASARSGAAVTLTATVTGTGGTPTGTVSFFDGSAALSAVMLTGGSATYTTSSLSAASHSITARYSGDSAFTASTSTAQTVVVSLNTVAVALTAAPAVSPVGGTVTLTATLTAATSATLPSGKITFYNGASALGSVTVANNAASLTTTALPAGTASLTAVYSGDTLYSTATSSAQSVVVRVPAATTTTLSSSSASVSFGTSITFTATVSSTAMTGAPTGTVTFMDGSTTLGSVTVSNGMVTYATSALAVGAHSITAVYNGDSLFLASTSAAFPQTVIAATFTLTTPVTALTVSRGQSVMAVISATPTGNYTGTLTFTCGMLPANASCAFAPASLVFSGTSIVQTTTLTFSTKSTTSALSRHEDFRQNAAVALAASFCLPAGIFLFGLRRRKGALRSLSLLTLLIVMSLGAFGLSGCAGSSTPTTAAGTYTVPVTATVNGATTSLNLSITVQ